MHSTFQYNRYLLRRQVLALTGKFRRCKVGVWRRKGFRSMLRDEWEQLDADDYPVGILPVGILNEDNMTQALLRRFLLGK